MDKQRRKQLAAEFKEKKATSGVYKVTNRETGSYFLRADANLEGAKNRFDFSVKINSCPFINLNQEWQQYGPECFEYEVLETMEHKKEESQMAFKDRLKKLEEAWRERLESK